ncbi:tRNA pseudouridine(55) synthase TruB [Pseudostreptobacillus hongkongensis]|uniref:tRNA pseudouridine(55) synthase TruB n=1 Tax=Pseudostreptobacillus hongkongensis TaxID=1162717 RepID=UPI0028D36EB1|nr:tRNA pseudouridine(55) synthase TruB [Pseudostreptobacillus hongkongensis]
MDYICILNKPKNITSFSYIQKFRKENNIKKIGHAGTLDPLAEGLMIVMVNDATKFSDILMKHDKSYYVEMELGYETDTFDLEGEIINKYDGNINLNLDILNQVISKFIGDIKQIPPMYSAIKKNGVKLYELARKNIEIELESRNIHISNIYDITLKENKISFRCDVSSGTYIRSLVRDLGRELKYFATMTKLVREKIDKFTLNDVDKKFNIEEILNFNKIDIDDTLYKELKNGMTKIIKINDDYPVNSYLKVYNNTKFIGIVEILKKVGYNYYIKRKIYFK